MNLKEAYTVLNLAPDASPEEVKKQYRKLAKEFHPDINKGADAEAKFKKISEAYQVIDTGKDNGPTVQSHPSWSSYPFDPFSDPFAGANPFSKSKRQYYGGNIEINLTLSFKESVQGAKREIKYNRQIKCPHCQGSGDKPVNNGCQACGGRGQVTQRAQGSVFIRTCTSCMGKAKTTPCTDCKSTGVLDSETSVSVSIPSAVIDGNILRLQYKGNFAGTLLGLTDQYTDVYVHLHVTPEPGLRLEGRDIVSNLDISLLDALQGCTRKVKSLDGKKEVEVVRQTKNKDEVILSVGDHNNIKHRVIINIEYPKDIDKLIDVLSKEGTG